MIDISPIQIIIVLVIALLVFGPKRLPSMGRDIGRSLREFRSSVSEFSFDEPDDARRAAPAEPETTTLQASDEQLVTDEPTADAIDPDEDLDGIVVPGDAPPG